MQDFPSNSQRAARNRVEEERPKVEAVTQGTAKERKPKLGSRIKHAFIGGNARDAWEYVIADIIVPAVQNTLIDALQGGIERTIRGETRGVRRRPMSQAPSGHVAYNRITSSSPPNVPPRTLSRQARVRHDFSDIVIPTRAAANEVLEQLYEVLSRWGSVPVGTLYELTNIESSHADFKWGWTSLSGARAMPVREGGFVLNLPDPEPLS